MLKQVTVPIIVDDHEPYKCGKCRYAENLFRQYEPVLCILFNIQLYNDFRCKQCLEEAK